MCFSQNKSHFIKFGKNKREVHFKGFSTHSKLVGTVVSDGPIESDNAVFYFEVTISKLSQRKGIISVGICDSDHPENSELGSTRKSYCLRTDGKIYTNKSNGIDFCPKIQEKDTIGCGIIFSEETIFFTVNGRLIKKDAFRLPHDPSIERRAAVSFTNAHCSIKANFGKKNFKFGIEDMLSGHYKEVYEQINQIKIDPKNAFDLVHEYLIHSGFVGTLKAFEEESAFELIKKEKQEEQKDEFAAMANISASVEKPRKKTLGPENLKFNSKNFSTSNKDEPVGKSERKASQSPPEKVEEQEKEDDNMNDQNPEEEVKDNKEEQKDEKEPENNPEAKDVEMESCDLHKDNNQPKEPTRVPGEEEEEVIDTTTKNKDAEMGESARHRNIPDKSLVSNDAGESELSEPFEIDPFFGKTVSLDILRSLPSSRQRAGRSESIHNPILTDFWKTFNENGEDWTKIKPEQNYYKLEERGFIRHLLLEGKYVQAFQHLQETFPEILEEDKRVSMGIHCLKLVEIIKENNMNDAIEFVQDKEFNNDEIILPAINEEGDSTEVKPKDFFSLVAYTDLDT
eukprot:CAMPEP_0197002990 /NCGR_PEP_ID=MMETSP1380-20130617/7368_1 /TAXON_ID=5936 /ORGANISM="Euplotes crassus, Strain CT5" /LENGTH=567 /DNA_ID=CAMNT_0042421351 /DNA_START=82 /DNA_END=1785 /DNA_ORIENTATION=+